MTRGQVDQRHDQPSGQQPEQVGFVATVWNLRCDLQHRWKRSVLVLLIIGVFLSLFIHIIIGLVLDLYGRNGGFGEGKPEAAPIAFAVFDSETFTESPEATSLEESDSAPSALESPLTSGMELEATSSSVSELLADQSAVPTLGGAGGGDLGAGMGGSGGAGAGTSFFGIASKGGRFCYIMDISASMLQGSRLDAAITELISSLRKLPNFSQYYILFYSSNVTEPPSQLGWNTARRSTLNRMINEIHRVQAQGGTVPAPAFQKAMELNPLPDVIFFLTDGQIPPTFIDELRAMLPSGKRVVVHAVAFGSGADINQMKDIAKLTGGQYKYVNPGGSP
jgi:hypothetical protein